MKILVQIKLMFDTRNWELETRSIETDKRFGSCRVMGLLLSVVMMCLFFLNTETMAQEHSLDQVLGIAQKQSLEAYKAKHLFLADYWSYQSYISQQKPHLDWYINPATYNQSMTLRYDYENDVEIYRPQRTLASYSSLSLSQNIVATGGKVYVETDLYRLKNLGNSSVQSWSATPVRMGISQPLFGFNALKWKKRVSPLAYEKAKQDYLELQQDINLETVNLFFDLLQASARKEIAKNQIETADTLFKIGNERLKIAAIAQEELLDLELAKFNAKIERSKAEKEVQKAKFNLQSYLGGNTLNIVPSLNKIIASITIDLEEAIELAMTLNPKILELKQKQVEAERDLDKAIRESRFSADLNASFGLNQTAANFNNAYESLLGQQMVSLGVSIPILDWGDRKGTKQMAHSLKEVVDIEVEQELNDFKQELTLKVIDFNIQKQVVESAQRAKLLSEKSYSLTKQRFISGNADVLKLSSSMEAMQRAQEAYLQSVASYWIQYYEIQKITLFDFRLGKTLSANFDQIIQKN